MNKTVSKRFHRATQKPDSQALSHYLGLDQGDKIQACYVWIDGTGEALSQGFRMQDKNKFNNQGLKTEQDSSTST